MNGPSAHFLTGSRIRQSDRSCLVDVKKSATTCEFHLVNSRLINFSAGTIIGCNEGGTNGQQDDDDQLLHREVAKFPTSSEQLSATRTVTNPVPSPRSFVHIHDSALRQLAVFQSDAQYDWNVLHDGRVRPAVGLRFGNVRRRIRSLLPRVQDVRRSHQRQFVVLRQSGRIGLLLHEKRRLFDRHQQVRRQHLPAQICTQDTFSVSGAANPVPVICGDNTGQHMYLDMEAGTKSWNIFISTSAGTSTTPFSRQWAIAVYQLPCDHTYDAPQDCLQYFTGVTGTIKSYNFQFVPVPVGGATVPGRQLSNQDYSVCVRTESGFCSITYSACPDPVNGGTRGSFLINLNAQTQVNVALSGDNNCQNDYLLIPGGIVPFASVNINNYINNIFCGTALGFSQSGAVPVTTTKRPFLLHFTTDSFESTRVPGTLPAEAANMGFCLNYQQHPCGTNVQP